MSESISSSADEDCGSLRALSGGSLARGFWAGPSPTVNKSGFIGTTGFLGEPLNCADNACQSTMLSWWAFCTAGTAAASKVKAHSQKKQKSVTSEGCSDDGEHHKVALLGHCYSGSFRGCSHANGKTNKRTPQLAE